MPTHLNSLQNCRVLVTDGDERASLAIVRSLGAAGASVVVCSPGGASLAGASKYAVADIATPGPLADPTAFLESLARSVRRHAIDCLLPVTEASLRPVLESRRLFDGVLLPFPPHDMFVRASDKRQLMQMADRLSVPVPAQAVLASAGEARSDEAARLRYPLVLKPSRSVVEDGGRSLKLSVRHVVDDDELSRELATLPAAAFPVLLQERVSGPGIGVFLLRWDDRILARFAHRRLREKPPSGGVSVYRESISPPAEALRHAESLLQELDWRGVAMVEFKYDERTDVPYLMEINGRFWGSLQLAIDAGVDFPRLLLGAALGRPPESPVEGRPGIRLRWLMGDLDHLLLRLRKSPEELDLPAGAPGRLGSTASFLLPWRPGDRWEVLRPSDPRPFLRELRSWVDEIR